MGGEHCLEVADKAIEIRDAALAALWAIFQEANHRDTGRRRAEMNALAVGLEERMKRRSNLVCPGDRRFKTPSLFGLQVHLGIINYRDGGPQRRRILMLSVR
jgi:hypothetical protein